jgi:hypothetical protein
VSAAHGEAGFEVQQPGGSHLLGPEVGHSAEPAACSEADKPRYRANALVGSKSPLADCPNADVLHPAQLRL